MLPIDFVAGNRTIGARFSIVNKVAAMDRTRKTINPLTRTLIFWTLGFVVVVVVNVVDVATDAGFDLGSVDDLYEVVPASKVVEVDVDAGVSGSGSEMSASQSLKRKIQDLLRSEMKPKVQTGSDDFSGRKKVRTRNETEKERNKKKQTDKQDRNKNENRNKNQTGVGENGGKVKKVETVPKEKAKKIRNKKGELQSRLGKIKIPSLVRSSVGSKP